MPDNRMPDEPDEHDGEDTAGQQAPESPSPSDSRPPLTLSEFLISAGIFEGILLLIAFASGWLAGVNPTALLSWSNQDLIFGCLATLPMLLVLAACYLSRARGIVGIRTFLRDTIGPYLNECRMIDLILLSLLAGVCEETLFRGFLYVWIEPFNPMLAILICNLLFGIAHAITPMYAMIAGLVGLYLTALMAADPTPNLLIPITAHSLYDFVAFLVVVSDYRRTHSSDP